MRAIVDDQNREAATAAQESAKEAALRGVRQTHQDRITAKGAEVRAVVAARHAGWVSPPKTSARSSTRITRCRKAPRSSP